MNLCLLFAISTSTLALPGCASAQPPQIASAPATAPVNTSATASSIGTATAIHLEAEAAQMSGPSVQTTRAGFLGAGYVSGFTKDGDKIRWTIPNARAGIYQARVRYSAPSGEKGYDLVVNNAKTSEMFAATGDKFATATAGKVELRDGENTVAIEKGWGYYDVDALDLVPASVNATLRKPPATLVDSQATLEARALMKFLVSQYGAKTLSGQYDQKDNDYLREVTKQMPAIRGGDLIEYSPTRLSHGSKPDNAVEKLIQNAHDGQIITLSWHWNAPSKLIDATYVDKNGKSIEAPWWRGFYTDASTFDLQKALADPNSADYKLLLSDMDAIALQLKKFSDARVPVLWRPLHEAEGGWFWWGAKGPESFKTLWRLMFDRLTRVHKLHNLIWVNSSGLNANWYPGDKYVDIVGIDAYPSDAGDPLSGTWDTLDATYGARKLLALSEFGRVPDVEKMRRFGVKWSYFVSWTGDLGPQPMPRDTVTRLYNLPSVLNQSGVKAFAKPFSPAPVVAPMSAPLALPPVQLASLQLPATTHKTFMTPPASLPTKADYAHLANESELNLRRHVLSQWFPRAVDTVRGGFAQNFAEDWSPLPGQERSIVYQSRLTWTAAQAAMRFPRETNYVMYSRHGADFLAKTMWDATNGGFYWEVEGGVAARQGEKHAYGNAFAIYALAANYQATRNAKALDLAKRAFAWLDSHAHDNANGGYYEALARDGTPMLSAPSPDQPSDFIGTRYGFKSMNTHIHLLEAFGALYEVWPNAQVRTRLEELFALMRDRIYVEPGALNTQFTLDWRPTPDHDSYGHDIETAYLLTEAAQQLSRADDPKTQRVTRSLVDHTLEVGFDATNGGFYDAGGAFGGVTGTDKIWWTQAEALNALLLMHERYPRDVRYWQAFLQQWKFIQTRQIDHNFGGWYPTVTREGASIPGRVKSDKWTECYHQGRAMLNVSATLRRLASER